jgi:hypothetical protein
VNTPFDPLDALAEGQPFDIIGWLESVFGLNLLNNLPGPTESNVPVNTPFDPLDSPVPTPGVP